MAFVNLSLLAGAGLVAIPVILHLVMRREPKRMVFPAVRFLAQRQETNRRELRLRHWILLALRGAAIALLALALARPSTASAVAGNWVMIGLLLAALIVLALLTLLARIHRRGLALVAPLATGCALLLVAIVAIFLRSLGASDRGLVGDPQAPVSAVLLIDTSPRMQFLLNNATRLDRAREMASDLLQQLPLDSEAAVIDSRQGTAVFAVDLAAAKSAIERLRPCNTPRTLPQLLEDALQLLQNSHEARREIYVFTDTSRVAWDVAGGGGDALRARLQEAGDVAIYLVDVGSESAQNFALGDVQLSSESMSRNTPLTLRVDVVRRGPAATRSVRLYVEESDPRLPVVQDGKTLLPKARLRSEQTVQLEADARESVEFRLGGLPPGVHQGYIELVGQDSLSIDNRRFFTVAVKDAWPILVVAPPGVETSLFTEAIAPLEFRKTDRTRFDCVLVQQNDLANQSLDDFVAVCLLDPRPMPSVLWERLGQYVRSGGSLAVFLGHNAAAVESFNQPAAQQLLAGRLVCQWRAPDRDLVLAPRSLDHPVMAPFRDIATTTPWRYFPVFKHWVLEDLAPTARTILSYSNNKPALLENDLEQGRVMVMTTPITDEAQPAGRTAWNELPTGENPWPYFVLVNEIMRYLANNEGERLNYSAGELVVLPNSEERDPVRYQLFTPFDEPQDVQSRDGRLTVRFTDHPGAYRLKGNRGGPVIRGFSVNLPDSASDLTRATTGELDGLLGAGRYRLARRPEELMPMVGDVRRGREFFPFLIVMVCLALAVESALANRFYRRQDAVAARRPSLLRQHSFP